MCGRFTLSLDADQAKTQFSVTTAISFTSYNIAPGSVVPIIHLDGQQPVLSMMQWGLLPRHANTSTIRPINARLETAPDKPLFRRLWQQQRCLIPATGFYEWDASVTPKQPYYFNHTLFAFAGLWDQGQDESQRSFTILTMPANESVYSIHQRMPVSFTQPAYADWLHQGTLPTEMIWFKPYQVSTAVNNPRHNDLTLIEPMQ